MEIIFFFCFCETNLQLHVLFVHFYSFTPFFLQSVTTTNKTNSNNKTASVLINPWILFTFLQRIKKSVKSSGILGRPTPAYVPYRPQVYGVPPYTTRDHTALYPSSDDMRLLALTGYQCIVISLEIRDIKPMSCIPQTMQLRSRLYIQEPHCLHQSSTGHQ